MARANTAGAATAGASPPGLAANPAPSGLVYHHRRQR